jgi:uncharacterized membrane-anchored protein
LNKKTILFILVVLLQLVLLLMIPIPRWVALTTGRTVVLETAPVDPYSMMRGYYVRLNYQISSPDNLPVGKEPIQFRNGKNYYVIMVPDQKDIWRPTEILERLPTQLTNGAAVIKGTYRYGRIEYGIEQYYLPENQRITLEELLRDREQRALVVVKISKNGQAAIVRIKVAGRSFEY